MARSISAKTVPAKRKTIAKPAPHIIVTGNPVDGFHFIGPFDNQDDAANYGDEQNGNLEWDWWVAPLQPKGA